MKIHPRFLLTYFLVGLMLSSSMISIAQTDNVVVLTGTVTASATGEVLVWVTVRVGKQGPGVVTNTEGEYRLVVKPEYKDSLVQFSSVGYQTSRLTVNEVNRQEGKIKLQEATLLTQEIVVTPNNTGFKPLEDGKWQSAFYREYFSTEAQDKPDGNPVEMLECDYWMQRLAPNKIKDKVLITNSRARANFDKVTLSSTYCLTSVWIQANSRLKYYYDSLSGKTPLSSKVIDFKGQKAVETIHPYRNETFAGHYTVLRLAQTGEVVQIIIKGNRRPEVQNSTRSYFNPLRFYKGRIKFVLNELNDDVTIRYNNSVPEFFWRNLRLYLKFDDASFKQAHTYNFTSMWAKTGEAETEPTTFSFRWKPGNALHRQAISKGEKFWELSNTILPNRKEESFLKILSEK
jgi:hypothetical protein